MLVSNKLKGAKIIEQLTNTDLNAVAAQFELKVDTVQNVGFNSNFIPGLGNEPSVLFAVFNGTANTVAAPIVGNSGVYVIKPVAVNISEQASNDFIQQKSATEGKTRNEVGFKFIDALRKNADMEDNRYLFY